MRSLIPLTVILVLALAIPTMAQPAVGSQAPDFNLKDQFGKSWNLSGLAGTVTVLVAANSDSGRMMGPWVDNLKSKFANKGVRIVGLLDLHSVPGIGRGIARSRIKRETNDPMMLDFSGNIGRAYGVTSKYPVVVVIDRSGAIRGLAQTTYNQQAFTQITNAVNAALATKQS